MLNPEGRLYRELKHGIEAEYEDNYWLEDAVFMERNSRDFASRIQRINRNAESICRILKASPIGTKFAAKSCVQLSGPSSKASILSEVQFHTSFLRPVSYAQWRLWWSTLSDILVNTRCRYFF